MKTSQAGVVSNLQAVEGQQAQTDSPVLSLVPEDHALTAQLLLPVRSVGFVSAGHMGTSLSGGQKQRIVMTCTLYRAPCILFMDEATSHLDMANESLVNQHIQQLAITRVLVAHRPETVKSTGR
nr:ATP-binding cassette domain-containing protein [uncultured Microbulbifer sp.]